ncbi:MAG: hypothetical protein QOI46_6490 [Alphaproteobacteria bacterium]|nr:hypothetical protein [Alphaproteobacteria bacterium]
MASLGAPIGRPAKPAEVRTSSRFSFLLSPHAACVTGAEYAIDGTVLAA